MRHTRRWLAAGGSVLVFAAVGAGVAIAAGGDGGEGQATGPGADRARDAALALFPAGRANSVELDSEDGATWEVEVTRADGGTVDVRLDDAYGLVVVEGDSEDADGSESLDDSGSN
jgi:hypothetical protein